MCTKEEKKGRMQATVDDKECNEVNKKEEKSMEVVYYKFIQ